MEFFRSVFKPFRHPAAAFPNLDTGTRTCRYPLHLQWLLLCTIRI